MAEHPPPLHPAGNVEAPAWLVLRGKGFAVGAGPGGAGWRAERDGLRLQADTLIELLGLAALAETRGADWAASDADIDAFLAHCDEPPRDRP